MIKVIEIKGLHNTARCFTDELEPTAAGQIQAVCDEEAFAGSRIRVMPDVHSGKGCAVGTTIKLAGRVAPGLVGTDIGCGMLAVKLSAKNFGFEDKKKTVPLYAAFCI